MGHSRTIAEFTKLFADFHRDALDLMHAISPGTLFKWGLRDREPLQHYTKGRVTMLGDAAHPMTPFLGQGACVAIEDAMVLGVRSQPRALLRKHSAPMKIHERNALTVSSSLRVSRLMKFRASRKGDQIRSNRR